MSGVYRREDASGQHQGESLMSFGPFLLALVFLLVVRSLGEEASPHFFKFSIV
jgi:hypothetical protein